MNAACYVLGLGNIGGAVAERLARTGAPVTGIDPLGPARDAFVAATGRPVHEALSDVALSNNDRVFVIVRTVDQAAEVLDEIAATGAAVSVFVMTTLDLTAAGALAQRAGGALRLIELPVSGGRQGALGGTLTTMAAGPLTDADRAFLLTHVASRVVAFERYGEPTAAKLHNNVLAAYHALAHAEVLLHAARHGLDVGHLTEVLDHSSGQSWMGANLAVLLDDLLEKDVALFEASYGPLPAVAVGDGSDLAACLADARRHLT